MTYSRSLFFRISNEKKLIRFAMREYVTEVWFNWSFFFFSSFYSMSRADTSIYTCMCVCVRMNVSALQAEMSACSFNCSLVSNH